MKRLGKHVPHSPLVLLIFPHRPLAAVFHSFFADKPSITEVVAARSKRVHAPKRSPNPDRDKDKFNGYFSDQSEDAEDLGLDDAQADEWYDEETVNVPCSELDNLTPESSSGTGTGSAVQQRKQCRLVIPACVAQATASKAIRTARANALKDISQLLSLSRQQFMAGNNGLQAYRARAVQLCLRSLVKNGKGVMAASRIAAEAHGSRSTGARVLFASGHRHG